MKTLSLFIFFLVLFTSFANDDKLKEAEELFSSGNIEGAIQLLTDHLTDSPDDINAYLLRADYYSLSGKLSLAAEDLIAAEKISDDHPRIYSIRGNLEMLVDNYNEAIKNYKRSLEIDSTNAVVLNSIAIAYFKSGKSSDCMKYFEKSIELDSTNPDTFANFGLVLFYSNDTLGAIKNLTKAVELNPASVKNIIQLGALYDNIGEHNKAITIYNKAIDYDPENGEAYCRRGIAKFNSGEFKGALYDFETGLKLNPELEDQVRSYIEDAEKYIEEKE